MSILDCTNQNIRSGSELKGFGSDSLYVFWWDQIKLYTGK